jgi:UDP-N-acetylmuramate dehydrogenase
MNGDAILRALHSAGLSRVQAREVMARHTSWRIGGPADYFCVAEDESQLSAAVRVARSNGIPWIVLGGGNNVLVSDDGIEGLVILNRMRGISLDKHGEEADLVCGAGVFFARAAQYSARLGYTGMEWGIAIPGTVGGGVVNNAGAHWSDVSRALLSASVIDADGNQEEVAASDLAYRYRQSVLKTPHATQTKLVVTECRFQVRLDSSEAALARVEEMRQHRLETQPVKEASAGSTFKNPPDQHAGALVDRAGLKGHRIGDVQIAPLHANFILNLGRGNASDVLSLIQLAQSNVMDKFGVWLEPEVQFVGRWSEQALVSTLPRAPTSTASGVSTQSNRSRRGVSHPPEPLR